MSEICTFRRRLLGGAGATLMLAGLPKFAHASRQAPETQPRSLSFYNRHTGERTTAEFWGEGHYQSEGLTQLDKVLRDHRVNEVAPIDRGLYDIVFQLARTLDYDKEIHLISGYRSMKTNQMLAARSGGVAKKSYHTKAMAMDIAMPGIDLADLRKAALSLQAGGVGYYPRSGFVHVDTGPVRRW
ncbi:DUF882 domain-containing protein [Ferrimonas balearica]|uniref:DUF882 domain-containing protein n=1 Tax=Ferrimonas balearica TaxID=44012 RepID=UPI001C9908CA|nr:DUF882 domain-containing protein [Ferrimonas balearica]MBY5920913.1 DUF882 domain-containing protein [Ferrimonas balearica]MBY5996402.1 DUF882 domain-containing protein [Ferrimonas balearica]